MYKLGGMLLGLEMSEVTVTESVSAFFTVMSEHNSKTNDPKVFKLGEGMTLGYPTNDMVLWFRGHILGLGLRQQQYGVCSDSMSAFYLT